MGEVVLVNNGKDIYEMGKIKPFLDEKGSIETYSKAEYMRKVIRQIKMMIRCDVKYHVYACFTDPTQLTILSRVISLLNEKLWEDITMRITPQVPIYFGGVDAMQRMENGSYFVDVYTV